MELVDVRTQKEMAAEIRLVLTRRDQTYKDLAAVLGWDYMRLWRKMSGRSPLTLDELDEIAAALKVTPVTLMQSLCAARDSNPEPADYDSAQAAA